MTEHVFAFGAMSCRMEITLQGVAATRAGKAARAVAAETARIERKFSRFRDDSIVAAINRAAGGAAVAVDDETAGLLDFATTSHALSDGLFDITSGALRQAWRPGEARVPGAEELEAVLARVGWRHARWERPFFSLDRPGMEIDLGGLGKEYAADRAATLLREHGIACALVNFGGDLHAVGPRADGTPWRVGIRHPRQAGALVAALSLWRGGLATSGDYERAFVIDGQRYSHLLDPRSGWPARGLASVSVVADSCIAAGALASIGMLKGQDGLDFLNASGTRFLAVDEAGGIHADSPNLT